MNRVRELFEKKKKKVNSPEEIEKIQIIQELFQNDKCFFNLDFETAIGILEFLEVDESEIIPLYQSLISPEQYLKISSNERILIEELPKKNI